MSYPILLLRIKAMMLDSAVFGILFIAMVLLTIELGIENTTAKALFILTPILLLEPTMIWITGGSFGHHYSGIKIINKTSGKNLFILNGVVRFISKTLFGAFSLLLMLLTKQHQSIHDFLSHSIVVFKNEATASPSHKMKARETTFEGERPSIGRRLVVVAVYSIMLFMVYGASISLIVSSQCSGYGECNTMEIDKLATATAMIGLSIVIVLIFGLLAKLPGAYYRGDS